VKKLAKLMGRVAVPLVTPFRPDEEIEFDALAELADFVVDRGYCDSLILAGTTGEFHTMPEGERLLAWRAARQAVSGRVPMVAGAGAASTRETVRLAQAAESLGFDAVMVVLPYYSRPDQAGIEAHFRAVAAAVSVPVLVYNIPLFTGVNMEPDTLARLAEIPNILGIKEEAGINPLQATAYALRTPPGFSIYCGDDTMVLQVLTQGGVGVVSGGSQVIGGCVRAMIDAYFAGDNAGASAIYLRMAPFFAALNQNGRVNPIPILRAAIELGTGIRIGPPRRPLSPATAGEIAAIRPIVEDLLSFEPVAADLPSLKG
jgi:4-hydroxy-tetrahydrodipicolinate synthase